ncbi:MAG TPA: translation initiation factor IF-2 N-terminal domain-containing protein, partial [Tepidisphaeraceae bacterium]
LPNYITSRRRTGHVSDQSTRRSDYDLYTSACFEPTIDYCVIKIPRWTFEKFPDADETLTTQMKSVGEAMAIGCTFKEALQKGIRSMEVKRFGFGLDKYDKWLNAQKQAETPFRDTGFQPVQAAPGVEKRESPASESLQHGLKTRVTGQQLPPTARAAAYDTSATDHSDKTTQGESLDQEWPIPAEKLRRKLAVPSQGRLYYVRYAMKMGWTIDQIYELTKIDRWFLAQMKELVEFEDELVAASSEARDLLEPKLVRDGGEYHRRQVRFESLVRRAKELGYSDVQLGNVWGAKAAAVRDYRVFVTPVYKLVDTCAAEFEAATPYYYSTYERPYVVADTRPMSMDPIPLAEPITVRALTESWGLTANEILSHLMRMGVFATLNSPIERETARALAKRVASEPRTVTVTEDEIRLTDKPKVIIIGGGPNRIGQGIEFDYCCVQAAFAMRELGLESVMINSNPETVSTDYDTSDLLFFEPLTHEDILNVCERLNGGPFTPSREPSGSAAGRSPAKPLVKGVIVQFGGQTPLNLARGLKEAGVPILGTAVESLDAAGDREQFRELLQKLNLKQPANGIARSVADARQIAREIGYPVLVRPSFVLGGRAMEIVYDEHQLNYYMANAVEASTIADAPILVDKFLDNATEVDVDCLADFDPAGDEDAGTRRRGDAERKTGTGTVFSSSSLPASPHPRVPASSYFGQAFVIGVMEHIEEAGIHSGDSACALPPFSLPKEIVEKLKDQTRALARALRVNGLMNVQYAIKDGEIYVIEVNPRASRTVPFVSKAQGVPFAKIAAKVMAGKTLKELGVTEPTPPKHVSVKEVVFPFAKFPGVDVILGPEMRSTGEVMGIDQTFPMAFAKSQLAAGTVLPTKGTVFVSVNNHDKDAVVPVARLLAECGFEIIATQGTFDVLSKNGVPATRISKLSEGRPNIKDFIKNKKVQLIINTPTRKGPQTDEGKIRALAVLNKVPIVTTITGANAAARAIQAMQKEEWGVRPLQEYVRGGGKFE